MRFLLISLCALVTVFVSATSSRAAEPEGVLLCSAKGGGFDCEKGKCNPSQVTAGRDMRLDFGAKSMCALRGAECRDPKPIQHAMVDEAKAIVATISADGATMLFRIGADMKMAMLFVIGTGRALFFEGDCRRP